MKCIQIIFLLSVSTIHSLFAQRFHAGISAGISTAQYDGDGYSGYHKLGLSTGAFVRSDLNARWMLQFEIIYIQKGAVQNPRPDKNQFNQYSLKLNYMEVPLLLKYKHKNFVLESGIGMGALIKEEEIVNYFDVTGTRVFQKTEIAFNLGINYTIIEHLDINWRYSYSILPVRSYVAGVTYRLNLGESNNLMTFTIKYTLSGKKKTSDEQ